MVVIFMGVPPRTATELTCSGTIRDGSIPLGQGGAGAKSADIAGPADYINNHFVAIKVDFDGDPKLSADFERAQAFAKPPTGGWEMSLSSNR
jgi:hypothetical protein